MIIASATLAGQTYDLCDEGPEHGHAQPGLPYFWLGLSGEYPTPAAAVDDLWTYLGITVAVEGWWQPKEGAEVDISDARRPVTVTEQECMLGDALIDELDKGGLGLETDAGTSLTRAQWALAHRRLRAHYEQLIAEELLEQVALAHDLECELLEPAGEHTERFWIVPADQADRDPACMEPLATGTGPLAAVLELQRDLDAVGIQ
jgi:hypothetical protein